MIAAAAFAPAAAATTTAATVAARFGFVHHNGAPFEFRTVELFDRRFALVIRRHFDKTKATGFAAVLVTNNNGGTDSTNLTEQASKVILHDVE